MTQAARIRHLERRGIGRRDEFEGVAADIHVGDGLFDLRPVACDALIPGAAGGVMRVRLDVGRSRSVGRIRPMTFEA